MRYPHQCVGWLYDVLNSLEWRISPLDVLETERDYPGLMGDLAIESWQRKIIREQLEGTGKKESAEIDGQEE